MDYLQIARDLIAIESVTGNEEPVAAYLERVLRGMGLQVRSQPVAPGRRNLAAGPERASVLFCTHMDTVPPQLEPREDAEHLWGRGACDTKGIAACFLEAGRRLLAAGLRDFGFLFVVGEEVDHCGAIAADRIAAEGGAWSRYVIVGEPTENRLAVGHKGALKVRARVRGIACHSAYPEQGDSALHRLVRGLERVLAADFGRSELLGAASVNIGEVRGGVAYNVLAPEAEAHILVRVVTSVAEAENRLRACFADPATGQLDPRVDLETLLRMESVELERLDGFEETVVAYGTDAPYLGRVGRCLLFGPGSILDAHGDGEKISKREMARAVESYVEMARRLIAQLG
jgi:acetylornithine deacetylase